MDVWNFTATMININKGHNQYLMEKCRMLKDYALFIDKVREYEKTKKTLKEAIDEAMCTVLSMIL